MIPAGNYRYHVWRDGVWWRAKVHHVDGREVVDLHVLDAHVVDGRAIATEGAFAAVYYDQARRLAGILQPPVKLGARA